MQQKERKKELKKKMPLETKKKQWDENAEKKLKKDNEIYGNKLKEFTNERVNRAIENDEAWRSKKLKEVRECENLIDDSRSCKEKNKFCDINDDNQCEFKHEDYEKENPHPSSKTEKSSDRVEKNVNPQNKQKAGNYANIPLVYKKKNVNDKIGGAEGNKVITNDNLNDLIKKNNKEDFNKEIDKILKSKDEPEKNKKILD